MKKVFSILILAVAFLAFSVGATVQATSINLTASEALSIAKNARHHYWSTMTGHKLEANYTSCT
ncbi:hypothetical protein ACQKCU_04950 [Heyndrickxia sporothermodurans]